MESNLTKTEIMKKFGDIFQDATSNSDSNRLAVESIKSLIHKDSTLVVDITRKMIEKINSPIIKEVLTTLDILDECMYNCGEGFRSEIGKFRFLNELLKLVSPNHKGKETPTDIRDKILHLLYLWTLQYPQETKIKEAYDMLYKLGVKYEPPTNINRNLPNSSLKNKNKENDVYDQIPKELLFSKDPSDARKASQLIERIFQNEKRKATMKDDIEKAMDNAELLKSMLNEYKLSPNKCDEDEFLTIKELYKTCKKLKQFISILADDLNLEVDILGNALDANDCLMEVCNEYTLFMEIQKSLSTNNSTTQSHISSNSDILNSIFSQSSADTDSVTIPVTNFDLTLNSNAVSGSPNLMETFEEPLNEIKIVSNESDIFGSVAGAESLNDDLILQPMSSKVMHESENQQIIPTATPAAVPKTQNFMFGELDSIVSGLKTKLNPTNNDHQQNDKLSLFHDIIKTNDQVPSSSTIDQLQQLHKNDTICLENEETSMNTVNTPKNEMELINDQPKSCAIIKEIPLSEIVIDINTIQPGTEPPRTVLDETNGLKVILHMAKDRPRENISVIVITTMNQNSLPISNYKFDASVTKPNKLHLLHASGDSLPGCKPFRPPSEDITQVLLILNKEKSPFSLTCIVSYCLENEPDPIKESITVNDIPYLN